MSSSSQLPADPSVSAPRNFYGLIDRFEKDATRIDETEQKNKNDKNQYIILFELMCNTFKNVFTLHRSVLVSSLFINLLGLALPLVILQVYDRIIPNSAEATLAYLIFGLIGIIILEAALKITRANVMSWIAIRKGFWSEAHTIHKILHAPPSHMEKENSAIWLDRLDALSDLNNFEGNSSKLVLLDLPFSLIFLLMIYWVGGLLILVPVILTAIFGYIAIHQGNNLKILIEKRTIEDNKKYDFVAECLKGIQTVKSLTMEPQMQRRYERLQQATSEMSYHMIRHSDAMHSLGTLYANMTIISLVTFGALYVIDGSMSIGSLACCTLLASRLIQPIMRGFGTWTELQNITILDQKLVAFENLPEKDERSPIPKDDFTGKLSIQNLTLASDQTQDRELLSDVNFSIPFGEITGLFATDEKAKTALVHLLKGDASPKSGAVYIDGYNLSQLSYDTLIEVIGYVSNIPIYFRGSILQNLLMFQPGLHREKAFAACRLIGLEDDIHRLPEGYDTVIGEGITTILPEGFLQRMAIARALSREPKILILDEANTMVDAASDHLLRQGLLTIKGKMTIILLSNRPSFLSIADKTYTIMSGKISPHILVEDPTISLKPNAS